MIIVNKEETSIAIMGIVNIANTFSEDRVLFYDMAFVLANIKMELRL